MGNQATASGASLVTAGDGANATSQASVAIGKNSKAQGEGTVALGAGAVTSADTGAMALGGNASGIYSVAVVSGSQIKGN